MALDVGCHFFALELYKNLDFYVIMIARFFSAYPNFKAF